VDREGGPSKIPQVKAGIGFPGKGDCLGTIGKKSRCPRKGKQ